MGLIAVSFPLFGDWELVLLIAVIVILFVAKKLGSMVNGLRAGISEFRKRTRKVLDEVDRGASDAGKSMGGIYGSPAYEALSIDNATAELYKPGILDANGRIKHRFTEVWFRTLARNCRRIWYFIRSFLNFPTAL
jgi:Sec-independent protein translocase protein TatA